MSKKTISSQSTTKRLSAEGYQRTASEAYIQANICEILRLNGIPHSVTDSKRAFDWKGRPRVRVDKGWPDVTAVIPWEPHRGRALFVEVKSATGRVRPEQKVFHEQLRSAGAVVLVPRSVEQFIVELEEAIGRRLSVRPVISALQ